VLVDAVDGRVEDIRGFVTERVREGLQKIEETGKRLSHDHLTRGMVGCYLSHLKVLEMIKSGSKPYGLVLEDDALFPEDVYTKHIKNALMDMPEDWDVILLGRWPLEEKNENKYVKVNKFWGTHGYLVNRQGADKITRYGGAPIDDQIDGVMGKLSREGILKIYAPYRNVIRVNTGMQSQVQMAVSE
jgi:GR25 family glycosyltransferase involved in LPS biosynthesis